VIGVQTEQAPPSADAALGARGGEGALGAFTGLERRVKPRATLASLMSRAYVTSTFDLSFEVGDSTRGVTVLWHSVCTTYRAIHDFICHVARYASIKFQASSHMTRFIR
jgi:hypothetical protein